MDNLGIYRQYWRIDFCPKLANGKQSLLLFQIIISQISKKQVLLLKWTTILKHTNNDDLIIVAILIFNSTLRGPFWIEIVGKHSTSRNQINLLLFNIWSITSSDVWVLDPSATFVKVLNVHILWFSQVFPSIVRATIASPLKIVSIFFENTFILNIYQFLDYLIFYTFQYS
jgi:hypothetical protein